MNKHPMKNLIKFGYIFLITISINMVLEDCGFYYYVFANQLNTQKVCTDVTQNIRHSHVDCFENITLSVSDENIYKFRESIFFLSNLDKYLKNNSLLSVWHPPKLS